MTDSRSPLDETVSAARDLVRARYPGARAAWLGGSAATGRATATSDLDVTVLLDRDRRDVDVHRESLHHNGWPVELFVHVDASVRHFVAKDLARRRPTMARLVADGVRLLGEAPDLEQHCRDVLDAGPPALARAELDQRRYALSDLTDDLAGGGPDAEVGATAVAAWTAAAELLLAVHDRWWGSGKWLARELVALDTADGTAWAARLHDGLADATHADARRLREVCDDILERAGGRLWGGYRASATWPRPDNVRRPG